MILLDVQQPKLNTNIVKSPNFIILFPPGVSLVYSFPVRQAWPFFGVNSNLTNYLYAMPVRKDTSFNFFCPAYLLHSVQGGGDAGRKQKGIKLRMKNYLLCHFFLIILNASHFRYWFSEQQKIYR